MKDRERRISDLESQILERCRAEQEGASRAAASRIGAEYDRRLSGMERVVRKYDGYVRSVKEENARVKEEVRTA